MSNLATIRDPQHWAEISKLNARLRHHTRQMWAGQISPSEWETAMQRDIAIAHNRTLNRTVSGRSPLWEDRLLQAEYAYLANFRNEWETGALDHYSQTRLLSRAGRYASSITLARSMAVHTGQVQQGYTEAKRIRDRTVALRASCQECIAYDMMGWQPVGALPPPGWQCACRTACRCRMEYRKIDRDRFFANRQAGIAKRKAAALSNFRALKRQTPGQTLTTRADDLSYSPLI